MIPRPPRSTRTDTLFPHTTLVRSDGTLAQWRDYLQHPALHPAAFADIDIGFEYDKRFRYASPRMDVATTPAIQAIGADSVLTLGFAFFRDGGEVTWDVAELWMSAKANDPNYIMAVRAEVPAPSMDDEDQIGRASCRERVCQYV